MKKYKFGLLVGTQYLYGDKIFNKIKKRSEEIADFFTSKVSDFAYVEFVDIAKSSEDIYNSFKKLQADDEFVGVITWMHTFSPSKMWIKGLSTYQKPLLQLHTQYNKEIPWDEIDMDFMNLNQSAHGDREHGFIHTRMGKNRKVISGFYQNESVVERLKKWMRSSIGVFESQRLNVVRFGDNMRNVAVTEGNKVSAQLKFGWNVDGYGVGELVDYVNNVKQNEIREQMNRYQLLYDINTKDLHSVEYQAKLQVGIRKFLDERNAKAFTTTFEDLNGLEQLPGLAVQDLMREGYGFGAEGDWKTAAMLRAIKLMSAGENKGTSFMEDYTYHLSDNNELVLGAHMLEVCPSISAEKARIEVHKLGIGGKKAPARLVFDAKEGPAVQVSLVDLGNRFRLIVTDCNAVKPLKDMPKLPVARAMWELYPDFSTATEAWLLAGGAHHTVMTYDLDAEILRDFATHLDIEFVHISKDTEISKLKQQMDLNDLLYRFKG